MYCMNNMVVVSHKILFIYLDSSFLGSFHDVIILHHPNFYKRWHAHFMMTNTFNICLEILAT